MAIRCNVTGIEEIKKLIEEGRVRIPDSIDALRYALDGSKVPYTMGETVSFRAGEDIPEGSPVYMGDDKKAYTWKTTRVEAKPRNINPKTALLEAEAGEDGVFRVEGEEIQEEELERLRKKIAESFRPLQEDVNRLILGLFDSDSPRWGKYRE